jgi:type IV secretory pathway VirB2 component (pilin)
MPDAYVTGPGGASVAAAAMWLEMLLTGRLATIVAVIAVGFLGYGMMAGRLSARRAAEVVLGCFIVFGAPVIAHGLLAAVEAPLAGPAPLPAPMPAPAMPSPAGGGPTNVNPFDPYSSGRPSPQ